MSSTDPSESDIQQVIDFIDLNAYEDRSMVINALKNNNNNAEGVVMQYFDNPEAFRQRYTSTWDDTMFAAERDGSKNQAGISFHIESPSQGDAIQSATPPPDYPVGAPSRPPSRTNNRSPLGRVVDWTTGISGANISSSQTQEDEDMQRAMRESAQEAGIELPQQESGVMDGSVSNPHFGPANRSDYDQGNWAMVTTGSGPAPERSNTPAPSERKRVEGAPAFLVQGRTSAMPHPLGGLLTILHEIPLARNVLLGCGAPAASYGHSSTWWNGSRILPLQVLAQLHEDPGGLPDSEEAKPGFEEEVHRLMAFLDSTERSYGTASVLADIMAQSDNGPDNMFYEIINERYPDETRPLVQLLKVAPVLGDDTGDEEGRFGLLDIRHSTDAYAQIKTLYECLDHIMWSDTIVCEDLDRCKMAMFEEMGEVLAIKLGGDGPSNSVDIPMEFYPERYLTTRKDEARRIQLAMRQNKELLDKALQRNRSIRRWRNPASTREHDKRELIKKEGERWQAYSSYLQSRARFRNMQESGFDTDKYPDYQQAPCQMDNQEQEVHRTVEDSITWTEQVLADLDEKVKSLEAELEQVEAKQRFLGRLLTEPNKPGRSKPMLCNKYLLRGVACVGNAMEIVYVCKRRVQDLIELDSEPKALDQWWKLTFWGSQGEQPLLAEKVEYERVLRDMWSETKNPLLIYATENALDVPLKELTPALDRFVRADNKAFRNELHQEQAQASDIQRSVAFDPLSPSKRKHRDSLDSMDSNRVSVGSDHLNRFDDPFMDPETVDSQRDTAGELMDMAVPPSMDGSYSEKAPAAFAFKDNHSSPPDSVAHAADPPAPPLPERGQQSVLFVPKEAGEEDTEASVHVETAKSPEMQERARLPAFVARTDGAEGSNGNYGGLDMEIPDHHD
ncbi:hypothetical protein S40285_01648 [Stachybotrys chlorohalonatus IBT 40285]|uniref:Ubiquitin interaction domain-containing protein n=1 Tax=Stachybotrys chlorohalonatus (strain IBT 40285) TaxID=1283841 RepID=A0A084QDU6_STAC4|nr:hypothetical protein S40285_01648 [Stachybotrys chlorohalonata IBT 40285]